MLATLHPSRAPRPASAGSARALPGRRGPGRLRPPALGFLTARLATTLATLWNGGLLDSVDDSLLRRPKKPGAAREASLRCFFGSRLIVDSSCVRHSEVRDR